MTGSRKRRTVCVAGLSLAVFAGMMFAGQEAAVVARDAWVRVPLPSKTETALFVVLENHSAQRRKVVSVSSEAATAAEMHEMKMVKMTMSMTPVTEIAIPAKGKTSLNPDGLHIMLFGLKARPVVGDTINVTLKLDDGSTVPVTATVRK
jgi:periplasmic copper chaperone A